jgi:hypothetical protein
MELDRDHLPGLHHLAAMELDRDHSPGLHHLAAMELDRDHSPGLHHLAAMELDRDHLPGLHHLAAMELDRDHLPKLRGPRDLKLRTSRHSRPRYSGVPSLPSKRATQKQLPIDTWTFALRKGN